TGQHQPDRSADRAAADGCAADAHHPARASAQGRPYERSDPRSHRSNTMTKLKLGPLADDKPVKLTVELPAAVHRDLQAYAAALAAETGGGVVPPEKLIAPM